jgi:hypothetical protein
MKNLKWTFIIGVLLLLMTGACEMNEMTMLTEIDAPGISIMKSTPVSMDMTYDLIAGQNLDVGDVVVWNDADNLYVKYEIQLQGWCLTETHLALGFLPGDIPQTKKGSPIPGQFEHSEEHDCITEYTYEIPLEEWGCNNLVVAAHAVVKNIFECEDPVEELYLADCGDPSIDQQGTELFRVELDDVNKEANLTSLVVMGAEYFDQVAALAATPDGAYLYAIDKASKHLGVYEVSSGDFSDLGEIIDLVNGVVQAAFSPYGELVVSSDNTDKLYVVDIDNLEVAETIELDGINMQGADIIFSADGTLYLYTNYGGGGLYKIDDLTATQPITPLYLGTPAFEEYYTGLAIRGAGTGNLVASDNGEPIYTISPVDGSNIDSYTTKLGGLDYVVGYGDMTVGNLCARFETAWGSGTRFTDKNWATYFTYQIDCCLEWIVYGSNLDGGTDPGDDALFAIDLRSGTYEEICDPGSIDDSQNYPNGNAYDPDNERIYFGTDDGRLFYHEIGNGTVGPLTTNENFGTLACGAWYDGKYYYVQNGTNRLYEVTIDGITAAAARTQIGTVPTSNGYGDIVFDPADPGVFVGSAGSAWYAYDINDNSHVPLTRTGGPSNHLQLAYGSNGQLYGVVATTGEFFEVTYSKTAGTVNLSSIWNSDLALTDLASGPQCAD